MGFYDNYVKLCNSVNKTPSAVAIEIGFSKSTVSRWKSGKQANDATLMKVADYFGCTIEALTAEAPAPHIKLPGNNIFDALQLFAEELPQEAKKPAPEGELNKAALLNAVDTMSREELIELLNKISKRLPEV